MTISGYMEDFAKQMDCGYSSIDAQAVYPDISERRLIN